MKKKLLATLLVAAMTLSLVACGSKQDQRAARQPRPGQIAMADQPQRKYRRTHRDGGRERGQ